MHTQIAATIRCTALVAASLICTAPAIAQILQDDPSSSWGGDELTSTTFTGNVVNYENLLVENLTGNVIPELKFAVPFVWPRVDNAFTGQVFRVPMDWSNADNGWHNDDYDGTSLTVRLTNQGVGSVLMSDLADLTGNYQLPLTSPCVDPASSPSCQQVPYERETRNLTDLVPVFSLGALGPYETKRFDLTYAYDWGDGRNEALPTSFVAYTLSPTNPLDCNGDGLVNAVDFACSNVAGTTGDLQRLLNLLPGDLDGIGGVAFPDFLVLAANFGKATNQYNLGDIDGVGGVAFPDFLVLATNFGRTAPPAGAAVPEPASAGLMAIGLAFLGLARRRRSAAMTRYH